MPAFAPGDRLLCQAIVAGFEADGSVHARLKGTKSEEKTHGV
jgi:hypothetical protein